MKHIAVAIAAVALCSACGRSTRPSRAPSAASDVQTIDTTTPAPAPLTPPQVLTDQGPPPKLIGSVQTADAPPPPTPQDEALRASLPFAPAIALDPVDGTKLSIRATTPTAEYKGRIFYFASEANKRTFMASPDQFTKGVFKIG